jgi:hypothetical protein
MDKFNKLCNSEGQDIAPRCKATENSSASNEDNVYSVMPCGLVVRSTYLLNFKAKKIRDITFLNVDKHLPRTSPQKTVSNVTVLGHICRPSPEYSTLVLLSFLKSI